MVKIRLTRTGKKHQPHYRIVAADSNSPRDGRFIEKIGYYNPRTNPSTVTYDKEILEKWISYGAQFTDTTHDIFVKEGVIKETAKRKARIKVLTEKNKKPESTENTEGEEKVEDTSEKSPEKSNEAETKPVTNTKEVAEKESPKTDKKPATKKADKTEE